MQFMLCYINLKKKTSIYSMQAIVNDHEHYFFAKLAKYAHI